MHVSAYKMLYENDYSAALQIYEMPCEQQKPAMMSDAAILRCRWSAALDWGNDLRLEHIAAYPAMQGLSQHIVDLACLSVLRWAAVSEGAQLCTFG